MHGINGRRRFALISAAVQVFGRRHDDSLHVHRRPASEKRQGTKSRWRDAIPVAQRFKQRPGRHRVAILATPRLRGGRLLPCSTRSIMRLESISQTFREATPQTRSPAP
jgi:hypothetical protein